MADFARLIGLALQANLGSQGAPVWTTLGNVDLQAASTPVGELRWSDQPAVLPNTPSSRWPPVARPGPQSQVGSVPVQVPFLYAYTADALGSGVLSDAPPGAPHTFALDHWLQLRIAWDALGTFATAPVLTVYNALGASTVVARGDGSIAGGHALDTGAPARGYCKGALYGSTAPGVPAPPSAGPAVAPTVLDGATGAVTPGAGPAWSAWQGLAGDLDYLQNGAAPTAATAGALYAMLALFIGPNVNAGIAVFDPAIGYTWV